MIPVEYYRELWHNHTESWLKKENFHLVAAEKPVAVKAMHSLISIGTEKVVTTQQLSEVAAKQMRVPYMKGNVDLEFTYGYSMVGKVINGPKNYMGKIVHLLHPHQEYAFVDESDIHNVPDGISPRVATLASNMETAVNAIWDAEVVMGDHVLVIGYGVIGALVALLAKSIPGVLVKVCEINENRANKAQEHGFEVEDVDSLQNNFDLAFNSSASAIGLQIGIDKTGIEGKVIELSWHGSKPVSVVLGETFHYDRKRIISSQVSQIPLVKQHRWNHTRRKTLVFDLLKKLDPIHLLERDIHFDDCPAFYHDLRNNGVKDFSVSINY